MKRILCIILAILLLTPTAFAEEPQMTYRLTGENGKVGDIIKLTVSVENAPACATYESVFTYDPEVLQPTGDYQKMKLNGLLAVNTNATEKDQKVIKVAGVAITGNLLEGTMDLLNISFKIIGTTKDEKGSLIDVYTFTFGKNDGDLTPVASLLLQPCRIRTLPAEDGAEKIEPTPDTSAPTDPEQEKEESEWYFDGDQAVEFFPQDIESSTQYKAEYEKDENGKTTGVILYDKEENKVGKLEVEEDEYGNLQVTDEKMNGDEKPFSPWFLLPIGAAVLIAIGGVILALSTKKKK